MAGAGNGGIVHAPDHNGEPGHRHSSQRIEEPLHKLAELSSQIIWTMNASGEAEVDSPSWRAFTGRALEQWLGWNWLDAVHPSDRARVESAWRQAVAAGAPCHLEFQLLHRSGEHRRMEFHAAPMRSSDGAVCEWVGTQQDVTDRERRESALRDATRRLNALAENSPLAIVEFDPDFRVVGWSREAERIFGWKADEITGKKATALRWVHEEDARAVAEVWGELSQGRRTSMVSTNRNYRKDGTVIACEWHNTAICGEDGRVCAVLSQALEVTAWQTAEEGLRQAAARHEKQVRLFDGVVSTTPDFFYVFDREGRFLFANRRLLEVWGVRLEDAVGKTCRELGYEQWHHDMHMREIAQVIATKSPIKGEVPFKAALTGVFGIYEYIFTPVMGPDGEVELIAGTTRDVTERKRAEEALRDSEERYRALVTATSDVIYRMSPDWSELRFLSGRDFIPDTREPSRSWVDKYIHPEDQRRVMAEIQEAIRSKRIFELEHRVLRVDGSVGWTSSRSVPLLNEKGEIVEWFGTASDITERKQHDERMRETQKLESIGLLAGGIAHDFNNLLTAILGNASLILDDVPAKAAARVREVMSAAERAAHLTRQLLAYSGRGQFVVRDLDVSQAVQEIADLVQFSIPKSVQVALALEKRLPLVTMDPGQLQQILMNLVINAGEAIGEGNAGRIVVATSLDDVTTAFVDATGRSVEPGRYVCVEVSDSGPGISEEALPRIFEPFFTTKFVGRGLGLAAVAGVLRSQGGAIRVSTELGRGTTFRIHLPAAAPAARDGDGPSAQASRGAVLVVDDERFIRDFIGAVLKRNGYRVVTASDGREALSLCEGGSEAIDLAILDVIMPVMGANEVLPAMKRAQPGMKVLLTSGYSESEARQLCRAHPGLAFLGKPYTAQQIARAVEEILGDRSAMVR